ncbi:MAG: hypothetical protein A3C47_01185 [Omnitrophica bacterium RIFCSPHIGHO2_02_FULL_51_18]|nr:MAG: hypothetical protein A3C47_01185 [Omnitrophica bacterium RIFCSPHIGHO2_02_FULL_51_18]
MAKSVLTRKNGNNRNASQYDESREIEKLAYQYFVERGYQNGNDQEDWYRAESIVKSRRS